MENNLTNQNNDVTNKQDVIKTEEQNTNVGDQSNQSEKTDLENKENKTKAKEDNTSEGTQSQGKNARFAQKRRDRELEEKMEEVRHKAYVDGLVKAHKGENPFTKEKINPKSKADIQELEIMLEMEEKGLDPIADYRTYVKQKAIDEEARATGQVKTKTQEELAQEAVDFVKEYPDVDFDALQEDTRFIKFASGKLEQSTLKDVYKEYREFVSEFEDEVDKKVRRAMAKAKASPGATGSTNDTTDGEYYSSYDEIKKLSQTEVSKNWEKVQKSLARLNKQK